MHGGRAIGNRLQGRPPAGHCRVGASENAALSEGDSPGTLCCFPGHSVQDGGLEGSVPYPVSAESFLPNSSPNIMGQTPLCQGLSNSMCFQLKRLPVKPEPRV